MPEFVSIPEEQPLHGPTPEQGGGTSTPASVTDSLPNPAATVDRRSETSATVDRRSETGAATINVFIQPPPPATVDSTAGGNIVTVSGPRPIGYADPNLGKPFAEQETRLVETAASQHQLMPRNLAKLTAATRRAFRR